MTPRFLYFDLGSTLIDELPAMRVRAQLTRERLAALGIAVGVDEFLERCFAHGRVDANGPYHAALRELLSSHGVEARSAAAVPYDHTFECLYEGVPTMLRELAGRYRLGVIANQSAGTEARLGAFDIRQYFEVVLSSAEFGRSKPDPEMFAEAERRAGCRGEELVMIGDRLDNDIAPANRRGWRTVRVRQGFSRASQPRAADERANLEIHQIQAFPAALNLLAQSQTTTPCTR